MTARLVTLTTAHAHQLEVFLADFDRAPDELHGYFCDRHWPIEQVVSALDDQSAGRDLPAGWVPCTTLFWETDTGFAGVLNIRHHLTPALRKTGGHIGYSIAPSYRGRRLARPMLAAGLAACRALGIERAMLTCNASNEPSWRTIEGNGGTLETEAWDEANQRYQRTYWIDLSD